MRHTLLRLARVTLVLSLLALVVVPSALALRFTPSPAARAFLLSVLESTGKATTGPDPLDAAAALSALAPYGDEGDKVIKMAALHLSIRLISLCRL